MNNPYKPPMPDLPNLVEADRERWSQILEPTYSTQEVHLLATADNWAGRMADQSLCVKMGGNWPLLWTYYKRGVASAHSRMDVDQTYMDTPAKWAWTRGRLDAQDFNVGDLTVERAEGLMGSRAFGIGLEHDKLTDLLASVSENQWPAILAGFFVGYADLHLDVRTQNPAAGYLPLQGYLHGIMDRWVPSMTYRKEVSDDAHLS